MRTGDRKALGAFYTPPNLAKVLAEWAVVSPNSRVLEPSIGDGALVEAVVARFQQIGSGSLVGYEIDERTCSRATERFAGAPAEFFNADFLARVGMTEGAFEAVVANPPFTRNHALSVEQRRILRERAGDRFPVSGAPGMWVYFICAAVPLLRRGGRLAFIVPGAAAFADYAQPVLKALREKFATVELVRVLGDVDWDGEAQERAVLILASGYLEGHAAALELSDLAPTQAGSFVRASRPRPPLIVEHVTLGELATIEIGVVTGANRYLLLDAADVERLQLSEAEITLTAARARHVQGLTLRWGDLKRLASNGEKVMLLSPPDIEERGTPVRGYLARIPRTVRKGTKWFKKRRPWWKVQLGAAPDAILTYMNHFGPRLTLVDPGITATNTLHRVRFHNAELSHVKTVVASALTSYTQVHAEMIGRVYGGGVLKFELHEARRLPILIPTVPIGDATFGRIDTALRSGALAKARALADEAVLPHFFGKLWRTTQAELSKQLMDFREARGVRPQAPFRG